MSIKLWSEPRKQEDRQFFIQESQSHLRSIKEKPFQFQPKVEFKLNRDIEFPFDQSLEDIQSLISRRVPKEYQNHQNSVEMEETKQDLLDEQKFDQQKTTAETPLPDT